MKVFIFFALLMGLLSLPPSGESLTCYQCNLLDPTCFSEPKKHQAIFCGSNESAAGGLINAFVDENSVSIFQDIEKIWLPMVDSEHQNETMASILDKLQTAWMKMDQLIRSSQKIPDVFKNLYTKVMDKFNQKNVLESLEKIKKIIIDIFDSEEMRDAVKEIENMMEEDITDKNTEVNKMLQLLRKNDERSQKINKFALAARRKMNMIWNGMSVSTQHHFQSSWSQIIKLWTKETPEEKAQKSTALHEIDGIMRSDEMPKVWRNLYVKSFDKIKENKVIKAWEIIYQRVIDIVKSEEIRLAFEEVMKYIGEKDQQSPYAPKGIVDINIPGNPRIQTQRFMCYKKVGGDSTQVSRGCMDASADCDKKDKCFACNSDDCNSSSSIQIGIITIFFSVLLALVLAR